MRPKSCFKVSDGAPAPVNHEPRSQVRAHTQPEGRIDMLLDYGLCMAIGQDAGNANARKHGRRTWNEDDRDIAAQVTCELLDAIGYTTVDKGEVVRHD